MIAYLRGLIAGLSGKSSWWCPYRINDDDEAAPTDSKAKRWIDGYNRGWRFREDDVDDDEVPF